MPPLRPSNPLNDESGLALFMTIVTVALLVMLIVQFDVRTRMTAKETGHFRDGIKATSLAKAGVAAAKGVLETDAKRGGPLDTLKDIWAKPVPPFPVNDGSVGVQIFDERGKFNLNMLASITDPRIQAEQVTRLRALFERISVNPDLVDSIADWIDADGEQRPFGAESPYYESLPQPYKAQNQQLQTLSDLTLIKGISEEIFLRLQPFITIYPFGGDGMININTAHPWVIEGLDPRITPELASRIAQRRPFTNKLALDQVSGMQDIAKTLRLQKRYDIKSDLFLIISEGTVQETRKIVKTVVVRGTEVPFQTLYFRIE